jgi:hypothetical protein
MSPATAAQTSFESILDMPATDVERPKPLPAGTYDAIVKGFYEEGLSSQKKTPYVRFTYAMQAAGEDVDEEELAAILTDDQGNVHSLGEKTIKDTYYTTPDALFRLTDTLENMGIDLEGKSVRAALSDTPNCSIKVVISHRASEDGQQIFAEVKRTLKAD